MNSINRKELLLIFIIVLFYTIGAVGAIIPSKSDWFLSLTPFNLLLTFCVVILAKKTSRLRFLLFLLLAFAVGIALELIGVHTGMLFGNYTYGNNLGTKIWGVPIVIGLNWGIVAVAATSVSAAINIRTTLKPLISAVIMTTIDMLIEPIAHKTDFWYWENNIIPIYNFICWFVVGVFLQYIFHLLKLDEKNKVYEVLLLTLITFFIVLNIHYL